MRLVAVSKILGLAEIVDFHLRVSSRALFHGPGRLVEQGVVLVESDAGRFGTVRRTALVLGNVSSFMLANEGMILG